MTVVDIRILMREILLSKASAVMLFHNHPSGNLEPSSQDLALTRRIKDALGYFDIRLLDHIILANGLDPSSPGGFYSLYDNGRLS